MNHYPITLHHIFISPGHNYFGRPKDGVGPHPTLDVDVAQVVAGKGLIGDRYFGVAAHFNAQITFVAAEVFEALQSHLGIEGVSPILTRRNIVISGVPLNQLIGQEFEIVTQGEGVRFRGAKQCSPCAWMDAAIGTGAQKFLRGRGGLRAQALSDGQLRRGVATLLCETTLDLTALLDPVALPRLP